MKTNVYDRKHILAIIKSRGEENPIHLQELAGLSHVNDRLVKDIIKDFRLEGFPISGSSDTGYFWAVTIQQLDERINTLRRTRSTIGLTIQALERTRLRMQQDKEQEVLFIMPKVS
jgi:hypothetical protein